MKECKYTLTLKNEFAVEVLTLDELKLPTSVSSALVAREWGVVPDKVMTSDGSIIIFQRSFDHKIAAALGSWPRLTSLINVVLDLNLPSQIIYDFKMTTPDLVKHGVILKDFSVVMIKAQECGYGEPFAPMITAHKLEPVDE